MTDTSKELMVSLPEITQPDWMRKTVDALFAHAVRSGVAWPWTITMRQGESAVYFAITATTRSSEELSSTQSQSKTSSTTSKEYSKTTVVCRNRDCPRCNPWRPHDARWYACLTERPSHG